MCLDLVKQDRTVQRAVAANLDPDCSNLTRVGDARYGPCEDGPSKPYHLLLRSIHDHDVKQKRAGVMSIILNVFTKPV